MVLSEYSALIVFMIGAKKNSEKITITMFLINDKISYINGIFGVITKQRVANKMPNTISIEISSFSDK